MTISSKKETSWLPKASTHLVRLRLRLRLRVRVRVRVRVGVGVRVRVRVRACARACHSPRHRA